VALSEISPLTPGVWEWYKMICKSVSGVPAAAGVLFPSSSNVGLSKDEKAIVTAHHEMFKTFKVIVQLCVMALEQFPEAAEALEDIAYTGLAGMRAQIRACDNMWMKKALPLEALPAWHALESSTISIVERERFFHAMQYAALKQQAAKPTSKTSTSWSLRQLQPSSNYNNNNNSKGKYSHSFNCNNNNNNNTTTKPTSSNSPSAGSSANHD
jgi:hypothetical protein